MTEIKVDGNPIHRGREVFFKCTDGVERNCKEIGAHYKITGMCFYQRWRRYRGTDDPRMYAVGTLKSGGRQGRMNAKPSDEWMKMTRPARSVDDTDIPTPTKHDNKYFPSREVKDESITGRDVIGDMERRHLVTKKVHMPKCAFSFGDLRW